ncbi:MAG: hypothetical protein NVS3B10_18110 [Polyangiales bacterium]
MSSDIFEPHEAHRFVPGAFLKPHEGQTTWDMRRPAYRAEGEGGNVALRARRGDALEPGMPTCQEARDAQGIDAGGPLGAVGGRSEAGAP